MEIKDKIDKCVKILLDVFEKEFDQIRVFLNHSPSEANVKIDNSKIDSLYKILKLIVQYYKIKDTNTHNIDKTHDDINEKIMEDYLKRYIENKK